MAGRSDHHIIYIALVLAVIAAIATAPADGAQALEKLQWLLAVSTAPEEATMAGAIDGTPTFPVSP